jgi:predicted metal-dependent phosphoesterase TrpH
MGKIDLHTHSTASDGSLTPTQLVISARKHGVDRLALTDHDTTDGLNEAIIAGENNGVIVISGIELSVNHASGSLHMLAYGFDKTNPELINMIDKLKHSRSNRNSQIVSKLNELGYNITWESIVEIAGGGVIGRGHIGQVLMQAGYFDSIHTVFDQLLSSGGSAYVDRFKLDIERAIELVHGAGGVAVWAHPGLHGDELKSMILEQLPHWVEVGLDGLESDYNLHSIELRDNLRTIAKKHGIIFTGGSDFHGKLKPDIQLGQGPDGVPVSEECYTGLIDRLEQIRN